MSELQEQGFGKAGVEAGMGYTPMEPAFPVENPSALPGEVLESGEEDIQRGAQEIVDRRNAEQTEREGRATDIEVQYNHQGGPDAGKPMPENQTVSAEQAAADLTMFREGLAATQAELDTLEIQRAIDALWAGDEQAQQQPAEQWQPQQQPVEQQQQQVQEPNAQLEGDELAKALQNPVMQNAVVQHVAQAQAQAEQARLAYEKGLQSTYQTVLACGLAAFPEFRGMNVAQAQGALHLMKSENPQRFVEVQAHIQLLVAATSDGITRSPPSSSCGIATPIPSMSRDAIG
jgi:hypothetical protein